MEVVIFEINGHTYAVAAGSVREIIDPVPVTPLPFAAADVDGLVNVSGQVMVQMCVARRLGVRDPATAEDGVVMILDAGKHFCACRVSRVCARIMLADEAVISTAVTEADRQETLLSGEFDWGGTTVLLLDSGALVRQENISDEDGDEGAGLVADVSGKILQQNAMLRRDEISCVVFSCGTELFALRFEDVAEVVEGGALTALPGAPAELPGIMLLRGEPLPVLAMNIILCAAAETVATLAVVVHVNGCRVGLLVERIHGIQRFAAHSLRLFTEEQNLLEGFVTADNGRLVALIRIDALSAPERFDRWRAWLMKQDSNCGGSQCAVQQALTIRLLLFRIGTELLALPLAEIERIEEYFEPAMTPVAKTGAMAGVIQVQGNILPVHAIEQHLGLASGHRWNAYLIVNHAGSRCAVPVSRVERVFDMAGSVIEPCRSGGDQMVGGIGKYQGSLVSLLQSDLVTA